MKFGRVLRDDDALAETAIGEAADCVDDGRVGVGGRDQLEQMQVARRIEEVRAERIVAGSVRERPSASAAIGMPDVFELTIAFGPGSASIALEQRLLDVEPLDDRFDDPVGCRERGQVVVEAAGGDQACAVGA